MLLAQLAALSGTIHQNLWYWSPQWENVHVASPNERIIMETPGVWDKVMPFAVENCIPFGK